MDIFIFLAIIVFILILQIFLSKMENKVVGLILPIIMTIPSLVGIYICLSLGAYDMGILSIPIALLVLILYNIPSMILFYIYKKYHKFNE